MSTRIAVSLHHALKTMWEHDFDTEAKLRRANDLLLQLPQPTEGYVYPDDVDALIKRLKAEYQ